MASSTRKNIAGLGQSWVLQYDAGNFQNSDVITTAPGSVLQLVISNKATTGVLFAQFFDTTSVPANSTVPSMVPIVCPANQTVSLLLSNGVTSRQWDGFTFSNGLCWASSTTGPTLTIDSTSSLWVMCRFVS